MKEKEERRKQKLAITDSSDINNEFAVNRMQPNLTTMKGQSANIIKTKPSNTNNNQFPKSSENTRIVTVKRTTNIVTNKIADSNVSNNFLLNRTVLAKDQSLPCTPVVVVKNLSATTTEPKIRRLCQGIGEVQVRIR